MPVAVRLIRASTRVEVRRRRRPTSPPRKSRRTRRSLYRFGRKPIRLSQPMDFKVFDGRPALHKSRSRELVPLDECHLLNPGLADLFSRLGSLEGARRLTLRASKAPVKLLPSSRVGFPTRLPTGPRRSPIAPGRACALSTGTEQSTKRWRTSVSDHRRFVLPEQHGSCSTASRPGCGGTRPTAGRDAARRVCGRRSFRCVDCAEGRTCDRGRSITHVGAGSADQPEGRRSIRRIGETGQVEDVVPDPRRVLAVGRRRSAAPRPWCQRSVCRYCGCAASDRVRVV